MAQRQSVTASAGTQSTIKIQNNSVNFAPNTTLINTAIDWDNLVSWTITQTAFIDTHTLEITIASVGFHGASAIKHTAGDLGSVSITITNNNVLIPEIIVPVTYAD